MSTARGQARKSLKPGRARLVAGIKRLKPKPQRTPLKRYRDMGAQLDRQCEREYGHKEVELLADEVGWDRSMLYFCILFHRLWPTKEDLARVTRRGLVFGHIRALLNRKLTARERERLERYVGKERLSVRQLQAKVRELVGKR